MIEKLNIIAFKFVNHFSGIDLALDNFAIVTAKYLFIAFILWLVYLWLRGQDRYKNIALYSGYSAILGILVNFVITLFYYHPRPFMLHLGKLLIPHSPDTSFPSDHTTFMLSIAFMLVYFRETRVSGIVLSILGLIGGLARVFCGIHFPLDIVGSIIVSLMASLIIYFLQDKLKMPNQYVIKIYFGIFNK